MNTVGGPYVPVRQARDYVPVRQARDYVPVRQARDYVPVRQARDYIPVRQARDYTPVRQVRDYVPVRQARDYVPVRQAGVQEEGGNDGSRVGQAGRLNHDVVKVRTATPLTGTSQGQAGWSGRGGRYVDHLASHSGPNCSTVQKGRVVEGT